MTDETYPVPGVDELVRVLMDASPSKSDALREDFVRPFALRIGGGDRSIHEIGSAYLFATDMYEAGAENRNAQPLYTHGRRIHTAFLPERGANLLSPYLSNPDGRMTKFADRVALMRTLRAADLSSVVVRELFAGALANRIAGKTLSVGKFVGHYIAAALEIREQPLLTDEVGDAGGKRCILPLMSRKTLGQKLCYAALSGNNAGRALTCLETKYPQPAAAAA